MPERGPDGRFLPGGEGGPGRPKKVEEVRNELRYLLRLTERVSDSDLDAIVDKAVEQAKEGDARAREWLVKYLTPTPERLDQAFEALEAWEEMGRTLARN